MTFPISSHDALPALPRSPHAGIWLHPDGRASAGTALVVVLVAITIFAGVLWLGYRSERPLEALVRDPAATFGYWPFHGMLSHLGVFLMIATSAVCLFVALVTRKDRRLLISIGLFSGYFALDDFFMLHEAIFPWHGVPESAVLGAMAAAALLIFAVFRAHFLSHAAIAIWLSGGLLAVSIGLDVLLDHGVTQVLIEDAFKFTGLALWAVHWTLVARAAAVLGRARAEPDDGHRPGP